MGIGLKSRAGVEAAAESGLGGLAVEKGGGQSVTTVIGGRANVSKKLGAAYLVNPFKTSSKLEGDSVLSSVSSPVHRNDGAGLGLVADVVVVEREVVNGSVTNYSGTTYII